MRRTTASAVATVGFLVLTSVPAMALVQPESGSVLPDYDFRRDGSLPQAGKVTSLRGDDNQNAWRQREVKPTDDQLAAIDQLRSTVPGLMVSFRDVNGLPKALHAYGKPMTSASNTPVAELAREFLRQQDEIFRLTNSEVDALVVARDANTHGIFSTVWLVQTVDGILVDHSAIRFTFDAQNRLVWVSAGAIQPGAVVSTNASISPEQAILTAAENIGVPLQRAPRMKSAYGSGRLEFEAGPFLQDITVEPMILPVTGGGVLTWRVTLEPKARVAAWYVIDIDARKGAVLQRQNLYNYVANNHGLAFNGNYPSVVFGNDPAFTRGVPQTEEDFGYRWQSTAGWTIPAPYGDYQWTTGNNVDAKEDWVGDNETTIGLHTDGGPNQQFDDVFLNSYATSTGTSNAARVADAQLDVAAVVTNLYFWNNHWHDYMYELGFTEAYGNFQYDNFGRGACGTDPVRADGHDNALGGSFNNANFGTPPEPLDCSGNFRPRMQQFLTVFGPAAAPTWLGDTSLDSDVIIHEYSHGTSHRLVGGPFVNCLNALESSAMGEGWGDWYASSYHSDPSMGEYSFADPVAGVRCWRMDQNPRTYADICDAQCANGCQVHSDGEIHATTLWEMRGLIGKAAAELLVTDALKLSPCSPSFLDFRDALLMADELRYGGAHKCDIWTAYRDRAMGVLASSDGSGVNASPDFAFRDASCDGIAILRYKSHWLDDLDGNGDGLLGPNETINLAVELDNVLGVAPATNITATVISRTPGITMLVDTRPYNDLGVGAHGSNPVPFKFLVEPSFICGSALDFDLVINWDPSLVNASGSFTEEAGRVYPGWNGGAIPGASLFVANAEGATTAVLSAPFAVSTAQNNTPGGSSSFHTLATCYTADETTCSGVSLCNGTCGRLTLPEIQLPAGRGVSFIFYSTYNIEQDWDGPYVEVSTDGGGSWSYLDTVNYNGQLPGQPTGCLQGDVLGINGPTGNGGLAPWTKFSGALGAYVGQRVVIRIANHQDDCVVFEGAYIDDVDLQVQVCDASLAQDSYLANTVNDDTINGTCTDADGAVDPGETIDATLTLFNIGSVDLVNLTGTLTSSNPAITIVSGPQSFGTVVSGTSGSATFRYTVASTGLSCFDDVDFDLSVTANSGTYSATLPFTETVRTDPTVANFTDDFEGGNPAWTPSLGPDGVASDFALRELNCLTGPANRWFWSTNIGMVPATCGTGEPDYSGDSDSLLTSGLIDVGTSGAKIQHASFDTFGFGQTVHDGFMEVYVDHANDGNFLLVERVDGGFGALDAVTGRMEIDLENNSLGVVIPPTATQFVRVRFRLRALTADPGATGDSIGMLVNDFRLDWQACDRNLCAPNVQGGGTFSTSHQSGVGAGNGSLMTP